MLLRSPLAVENNPFFLLFGVHGFVTSSTSIVRSFNVNGYPFLSSDAAEGEVVFLICDKCQNTKELTQCASVKSKCAVKPLTLALVVRVEVPSRLTIRAKEFFPLSMLISSSVDIPTLRPQPTKKTDPPPFSEEQNSQKICRSTNSTARPYILFHTSLPSSSYDM